jgi:hypothetical protein
MKKIIKLTESDLVNIVKKVLTEQVNNNINPKNLKFGDGGRQNPNQINDVKELQQKLGFSKPTGYFGKNTKAALDKALGKPTGNYAQFNPNIIGKDKTRVAEPISNLKTKKTLPSSIESSKIIPDITGSDRVNKELFYINARPKFNGKPFFLVDPKLNIVYAFDENHKFIAYSQSIAGADKQQEKIVTYEEWCNISGLKYDKFAKLCKGQEVRSSAESAKTKAVTPLYPKLGELHKRYQAPGIYQTSSVAYEKGYTGKPGVPNEFFMQTPEGVQLPTAIHALVNIPNRVTADAELKKYLDTEKNKGRIPKEYIDIVTKLTSNYDLSSGCFNVDPTFANNPKVIAIAKRKAYVFIMSEKDKNYLVVVPPQSQDEFFSELKGDGQMCRSIDSIASNLASEESKTSIA